MIRYRKTGNAGEATRMTTRDRVLSALLEEETGVSGQWLADGLGVSRSAVWKAVIQLRAEGYIIEGTSNRGYRLLSAGDRLSVPAIEKHLKTKTFGRPIELHDCLDSTNNRARTAALEGASHGTLIIADSQTGGKGRMGRSFFSPEHSGIYISYVLRPTLPADRAAMITSLAAVAVARAIEEAADIPVRIKWVNDLYIGEKKVCGILCEAAMSMENQLLDYAVLGIGVNTAPMVFPGELQEIATSIGNETGKTIPRSALIAGISNHLEALWGQLETGEFLAESRRRSNVLGREIYLIRGREKREARALDLDDQGRLIVETAEGRETVGYGEISLRVRKEEGGGI